MDGADSAMMSAPKGGCLSAQLARVRHTAAPRKTRIFMWAQASVELPNEPIQFGRDPDKNFTDNVDHLAVLGINRAFAASASSEERVAILGREKQSHGDTLFRRRYRLCVWQVSTNRHLALGRGPQDRVHFALDNTTRVRRHEDFRFIPRLYIAQLVLTKKRNQPRVILLDKAHHRHRCKLRSTHPGAEREIRDAAVGRREVRGAVKVVFCTPYVGFSLDDLRPRLLFRGIGGNK